MFPASVPFEQELGLGVTLELSPHGGHVGFVAGILLMAGQITGWRGVSWGFQWAFNDDLVEQHARDMVARVGLNSEP